MAAYKDLIGQKITKVTSNPGEPKTGQMWYNSTDGKLRGLGITSSWISTGAMLNSEYRNAGAGTQTAGLAFGGSPNGTASDDKVEEYNGSGWTSAGQMPSNRSYLSGCGLQTAALSIGGAAIPSYDSNVTLEYDGTNWTTGGNLNTPRNSAGNGMGVQTAALLAGGDRVSQDPTRAVANCEQYNGSSWTAVTALPRVGESAQNFGTSTAGTVAGGFDTSPNTALSDSLNWDGSSWTASGNLPSTRQRGFSFGIQTAGVVCGGNTAGGAPTIINTTLDYDGSTFSVNPATLSSPRQLGAPSTNATSSGGWVGAGTSPPLGGITNVSEEYNSSVNSVSAAAWASGGALGTARYQIGGAGDLPAGLAYGGYGTSVPGNTNKTEEYDGTSWSEVNDMANPRGQCSGQHIGTQTSALAAGGTLPGSPNYGALCEEYDGTNWTTGGALTEDSGRSYLAGFGTQTAAVAGGGYAQTGATANSEHYDGSSWTAANNMNTGRYGASGTGTQTAGLAIGQYPGTGTVEEYNGTNWTTVTSYPAGRFGIYGGMGTQTDSIHAGGSTSSTRTTQTFGYDGTTFSTRPSMANALSSGASGGTSTSAFIAGGRGSPPGPTAGVTTTEEFTGETETANIADFTTS